MMQRRFERKGHREMRTLMPSSAKDRNPPDVSRGHVRFGLRAVICPSMEGLVGGCSAGNGALHRRKAAVSPKQT